MRERLEQWFADPLFAGTKAAHERNGPSEYRMPSWAETHVQWLPEEEEFHAAIIRRVMAPCVGQ